MKHSSSKRGMFKVKSRYLENYKCSSKGNNSGDNGMLEYDPKSRNQLTKNNTMTFIPRINSKSKKIKRDLNISDHLYRDASHRRESMISLNKS